MLEINLSDGKNEYWEVKYMIDDAMDKAHYYLDIAANYKASIDGISEYINCLCNMGDPNALNYIENSIKRISEIISNAEEPNEPLEEFLDFLYRRLVYSLITHRAYDTAENILKDMIETDINIEFANNELAYLQKIRLEENTTYK